MAEKQNEIILVWDNANKVWKLDKYSAQSNIGKYIKSRSIKGGPSFNRSTADLPVTVQGHPMVKMEDVFVGGQLDRTILRAPENVLAQYNPLYATTEQATTQPTSADKVSRTTSESMAIGRGKRPKEETKVITPQEFSAREFVETPQVDTPIPTSLPKSAYTKEEILANGSTVDSGRGDGTQIFNFLLVNPDEIDPDTGEPLKTPLEAVLLPETEVRRPGSTPGYYVASMNDAINSISQNYISRNNVADLKKQLWEANFLDVDQYNQSIRGNMANVFDEFASIGLRRALESVSVKNFPTLVQGRGQIMGLSDHLNDMFTPGGVTTRRIGLPSSQSINQILDDTYQTYYGRKPTPEEYEAFGQEVQKFALENATRQVKAITPEGTGVTFFQGQEVFSESDLAQVAEGLTRGNPERKAYYGVQEYGKAFDRVFGTGGGLSSQTELTELLR